VEKKEGWQVGKCFLSMLPVGVYGMFVGFQVSEKCGKKGRAAGGEVSS
jgi:hypothetical protein